MEFNITNLEGPSGIVLLLIAMGRGLKASPLPDKFIPFALPILGALLNFWRMGSITFSTFLVGCNMGALAVWGNQIYRQSLTNKGSPEKPVLPTAGTAAMLVAGLLGVGALVGCATFETRAYQTLSGIALTVDSARLSYLDYTDTHGKDESLDKTIRDSYAKYQSTMRVAKTVVWEYRANKSSTGEVKVNEAINAVAKIADSVIIEFKAATKERTQ